jgi:methionine aminopeptidase
MPFIILKKVGNQTLSAANTFYDLAWDGADTYNYQMTHSSTVNNHQITIQKAGVYEINYKIGVNTSSGHVSGAISINGVNQSNFVQRVGNNSGQFEKVQLVQATTFAVGDVITIQAAAGTAGAAADAVCVASIRMIVPT